eukprot:803868_1
MASHVILSNSLGSPITSIEIQTSPDSNAATVNPNVHFTIWFNSAIYQTSVSTPQRNTMYTKTPTNIGSYCSIDMSDTKVMVENDNSNSVIIDWIKVTTSSGRWYGINAVCAPSSFIDDDFFKWESWLAAESSCESGYTLNPFCIDNEDSDCGPAKQIYYFDTATPDAYISYARRESGVGIAIESNTCNPTNNPTNNPTKTTQNPSNNPTGGPTDEPTRNPSTNPTNTPTDVPTLIPSYFPSVFELETTTINPTDNPTEHPAEPPSKDTTVITSTDKTNTIYDAHAERARPMDDTLWLLLAVFIVCIVIVIVSILFLVYKLKRMSAVPVKNNDQGLQMMYAKKNENRCQVILDGGSERVQTIKVCEEGIENNEQTTADNVYNVSKIMSGSEMVTRKELMQTSVNPDGEVEAQMCGEAGNKDAHVDAEDSLSSGFYDAGQETTQGKKEENRCQVILDNGSEHVQSKLCEKNKEKVQEDGMTNNKQTTVGNVPHNASTIMSGSVMMTRRGSMQTSVKPDGQVEVQMQDEAVHEDTHVEAKDSDFMIQDKQQHMQEEMVTGN